MRKLLASLAVAALPLGGAVTLAACSTFEQVKPHSPRQALAEAEIMFVGVVDSANILTQRGYVSPETARQLVATFDKVSKQLDQAFTLLKQGEDVAALLKSIRADLDALALEFSLTAEQGRPMAPAPAQPGNPT